MSNVMARTNLVGEPGTMTMRSVNIFGSSLAKFGELFGGALQLVTHLQHWKEG